MGDRGILFSAPMVRALIREAQQPGDGKTQTRRLLTLPPRKFSEFGASDTTGYHWHFRDGEKRWHDLRHEELLARLPHASGDRLYVREQLWVVGDGISYAATELERAFDFVDHHAYHPGRGLWLKKVRGDQRAVGIPAIHMPRWASRLTLLVDDVRVERLKSISREDAIAEGLIHKAGVIEPDWWLLPEPLHQGTWLSPVAAYAFLWGGLHTGAGTRWDDNPWVVAVTFRVIASNIDQVPA